MIMRSIFILGVLTLLPSAWGFSPSHVNILATPNLNAASASVSTTQLQAVPTSIDTFTSGLASIARLPRGVTVSGNGISSNGPAASYLPTIKKLYDIENNRDCRFVRERITELDLVVEQVIPSTTKAKRSIFDVPTLIAADVDGKEVKYSGVRDILAFFDDEFVTRQEKQSKEEEEEEMMIMDQIKDKLSQVASYLPGILRGNRGTRVCTAASLVLSPPRPEKTLILYSYEGNQFCRLVREVLTELDITYELRSAGKGSPRREELAEITGGSSQCPYLIDPNEGGVEMAESKDIVEYLYSKYALWTPPSEILRTVSGIATPLLAPLYKVLAPLQAGSNGENEFDYAGDIAEAKAEIYDEIALRPVVIYTYELSPFCTEAVAVLKSTGIAFEEISLGKEWIPGLITAPAKRAALLEITGQSSLPHVFIGGTSIGGLYSGSPGLLPALEKGELMSMVEEAKVSM